MVEVACTGAEARRLLREQSPALAILDAQLPDMTGDQLLAECTGTERSTVAIMMTAHPTPELALQFMRLGAYGYVRKPVDPASLLDLCAKALRERALLRVEESLRHVLVRCVPRKRSSACCSRASQTPSVCTPWMGRFWP